MAKAQSELDEGREENNAHGYLVKTSSLDVWYTCDSLFSNIIQIKIKFFPAFLQGSSS